MPIIEMRLNSDLESCTQSIQVLGMPLLSTTRKNENYLPLLQIFTNVCKDLLILMGRWRTTKIDSTHSSGVVSWLVTNFLLNLLEVFLFASFGQTLYLVQVLKPDGSPYTKMGTDGEVRLWVYWENTNW